MGTHLDLDDVSADHPLAKEQLAELRLAAARYETARRMNPRQWAAAWEINIMTGKPFDEIIDNMGPFMVPNVQADLTGAASCDRSGRAAGYATEDKE